MSEPEIEDKPDVSNENNDSNDEKEQNESDETTKKEPKKRGLPKKLQQNQAKYQEALERQQRMKGVKTTAKKAFEEPKKQTLVKQEIPAGMRRINVNGSFKLVPIKGYEPEATETNKDAPTEPVVEQPSEEPTQEAEVPNERSVVPEERSVGPEERPKRKNPLAGSKKVPSKYAKEIDKTVKSETIKKVKNFSDLRRLRAMEQIDVEAADIDINKASVHELRKLRTVQRKKEMAEAKKRSEGKRETIVQNILNDDNMSKFSKTLAIKNLSVGSRHTKQTDRLKARVLNKQKV